MHYVAYDRLGDTPNVIVDGAACPSTVLSLSHWPKSGSPAWAKADLSAELWCEGVPMRTARRTIDLDLEMDLGAGLVLAAPSPQVLTLPET